MKLNKFTAKFLRTTLTTSLCVLLFTAPILRAQDRTHSGSSRTIERRNSGNRGRNLSNELDRKLSPDLKTKLNDSSVDRVKIVLQFNAAPSAQTIEILGRAGVLINPKDKFDKLESRTVELPKSLVVELAAQNEMNFASSNREVRSLGHLSSTTGADLARGLTGTSLSSNLDGSGIGIAFIDSGIDREHKSFLDRSGSTAPTPRRCSPA